jgi:ribonuclease P protein component
VALPKPYRLRRRSDFDSVYQTGARRRATHLHLVAVQSVAVQNVATQSGADQSLVAIQDVNACHKSRFGISISKKVSKLAVVRNRIKRQIRAALRKLLPLVQPGWSVVIIVRSSILECDYWQILQELEQLLLKAGVLRGD